MTALDIAQLELNAAKIERLKISAGLKQLAAIGRAQALRFLKFAHECDIPAMYCIRRGTDETVSSASASVEEFQRMICHLAIRYAEQFGAVVGIEYIHILGGTLLGIDKEEFAKHCKEQGT